MGVPPPPPPREGQDKIKTATQERLVEVTEKRPHIILYSACFGRRLYRNRQSRWPLRYVSLYPLLFTADVSNSIQNTFTSENFDA